MCTFLTAIRL